MCSGSEAGSYFRLIDFLSLNSRRESNKEEGTLAARSSARFSAAFTSASLPGVEFRVLGFVFRVEGLGLRRIQGLGFRI